MLEEALAIVVGVGRTIPGQGGVEAEEGHGGDGGKERRMAGWMEGCLKNGSNNGSIKVVLYPTHTLVKVQSEDGGLHDPTIEVEGGGFTQTHSVRGREVEVKGG